MEKVTFTNSAGNSIIFNSDVGSTYQLLSKTGFDAADVNPQMSPAYGINGQIFRENKLKERYLKIDFLFEGADLAALADTKRTVIGLLNPLLNEGVLVYENESGDKYRINAAVVDGPITVLELPASTRMQVAFVCAQPLWESYDEYSETFSLLTHSIGGGAYTYDVATIPLTIGGGYKTPVRFVIEATTSGDDTLINIINGNTTTTTGNEYIAIENPQSKFSLASVDIGDIITIDTDERNISVTYTDDSAGTTQSAFEYINPASTFFQLEPGSITLTAYLADWQDVTGNPEYTGTLYWRNRFVGV